MGLLRWLGVALVLGAAAPAWADFPFGHCGASCGSYSQAWSCWCDEACLHFGDCCADYRATCRVPALTDVSPKSVPTVGGVIQLSGEYLTEAMYPLKGVQVGGAPCAAADGGWTSTSYTCTAPPGVGKDLPVTGTFGLSDGGTGTFGLLSDGGASVRLSYDPPQLGGASPGVVGAGDTLSLTGLDFGSDPAQVQVTLGGLACTQVAVATPHTKLTCVAPVGQGVSQAVQVTVAAQPSGFLYVDYAAPSIASLSPTVADPAGTTLTITGQHFGTNPTVTVGGVSCPLSAPATDTQLTCAAPPGTGTQQVQVMSGGQPSNQLGLHYALTLGAAAYSGPTAGGTDLVLSGSGFPNGMTLRFGSQQLFPRLASSSSLTFVVPAGTGTNLLLTLIDPLANTYPAGTFSYLPPQITSVSPSTISVGDLITLTGNNFAPGATSVLVDGQSCALNGDATYDRVSCIVSGPLSQAPKVVVTVAGQSSSAFSVSGPAPQLSGLSPNTGPGAGNITLTLFGAGFGTNPSVKVGSNACPLTGAVTDGKLTCTLPAGSGSSLPVTVTVGSATTNSLPFSYDPQVTGISPNHGPTAGQTLVTVTGSGLGGTTAVTVNGVGAPLSGSPTATSVSFLTPAGVGRSNDVLLQVGGTVLNPMLFDYDAPVIAGLSPATGAAGSTLQITGTNFGSTAPLVTVGGRFCAPIPGTATDSSVSCKVPAGEGSNQPVVAQASGQKSNVRFFSYSAPQLTAMSPASGPTPGGGTVTLSGTNLGGNPRVLFGSNAVITPTVPAPGQLAFAVPPGQGSQSVQVAAGDQVSNALVYAYDPPALVSVGLDSPGVLALLGSNLGLSGAAVTVGGLACQVTSQSHTRVTCALPVGAGTQLVVLTLGSASSNAVVFTYPAPRLLGVSPATGPTVGSLPLTLTGSGFGSDPRAVSVEVGNQPCPVTSASDGQVVCTLPAGAGSNLAVAVTAGGQLSNLGLFSYQAPVVATVQPALVQAAGGALVRVSGLNFGPAPTLLLDGQSASAAVVSASQTQLSFIAPVGVGLGHSLQVVAGGQTASAVWGYLPPQLGGPSLSTLAPGQTLSLTGVNFGPSGASVRVGGQSCPVTAQSDTALSCTVPDGTGVDLSVTVTAGGQTSKPLLFTYAAPTLAGISPGHGPAAGGIPVTLTGAGWGTVHAVRFGSTTVAPDSVSGSSLTFTLPAGGGRGIPVSVLLTSGETNPLTFDYDPSAPVAQAQSATTAEDTDALITLSATDADGDALTYAVVAQPPAGQGTVTLSGATALYHPAPDFNGTTYFTFKANDGALDSNTATVSLTVTPVNDPPVAQDVSAATLGQPVAVTLRATDVDGDALTYAVAAAPDPAQGTVALAGAVATFTPARGFVGNASFSYRANDGQADSNAATATVAVGPAPDAPPVASAQAVTTAEDQALPITLAGSDPDGDPVTFSVGQPPVGQGSVALSGAVATYTPPPNWNGTTSFAFYASDGVLTSAPATVTVTVTPVNDPPTADSQAVTTLQDTALDIQLTASDVDGDVLTFAVQSPPDHGAVTLTGSLAHYTPPAGWAGSTGFTFSVTDGQATATAQVTITVGAVNHAPVWAAPTPSAELDVVVGELVEFQVAATDADGTVLQYGVVGLPASATFDGATGQFSWTPVAADVGVHAVVLEATDGTDTILRGLTIVVAPAPGTSGSTSSSTGSAGSTGTSGTTGSTGSTGASSSGGETGSTGSSTTGSSSSSGSAGSSTGSSGSTGGHASTTGSTGSTGSNSDSKKSGCSHAGGALGIEALALAWLARRRRRGEA